MFEFVAYTPPPKVEIASTFSQSACVADEKKHIIGKSYGGLLLAVRASKDSFLTAEFNSKTTDFWILQKKLEKKFGKPVPWAIDTILFVYLRGSREFSLVYVKDRCIMNYTNFSIETDYKHLMER
jgi:hypothetical protein